MTGGLFDTKTDRATEVSGQRTGAVLRAT